MAQGIDLKTAAYRYVKSSVRTFVEGGRYARDKKPKSMNWLMGVIRSSGVDRDDLMRIFSEREVYPVGAEEKVRFEKAKQVAEGIAGKQSYG